MWIMLTDSFYDRVMRRFDRTRSDRLNFDDYVFLCVMLQKLTSVFKEKDRERRGKVTVSYEDFLIMVFDAKV